MVTKYVVLALLSLFWDLCSPSPLRNVPEAGRMPTPVPTPTRRFVAMTGAVQARATFTPIPYVPGLTIAGIPTNFPTTLTASGTTTSYFDMTVHDPFLGPGQNVWRGTWTMVQSTIEEWTARLSTLPFPVSGRLVSTVTVPATVSRFCWGCQGQPQSVWTTEYTSTGMQTEFTRVLEFSLTEFPTAVTTTYTSTSTAARSRSGTEAGDTYVIVETVVEEWLDKPTSFPFTLTQTATATTIKHINNASVGDTVETRTYHPTLVVESMPTPTEPEPIEVSYPPPTPRSANFSATHMPTYFPTTITVVSRFISSYGTTSPFMLEAIMSTKSNVTVTSSLMQPWPYRPTTIPFSITEVVVATRTEILTSRIYIGGYAVGPPGAMPAQTLSSSTTYAASIHTFPFSLTEFPTTLTSTYTTTTSGVGVSTLSWNFSLGPLPVSSVNTEHWVTVIVETVTEIWSSKPTALPYTLTQTAEATRTEIRYYYAGEDTLTGSSVYTTQHYPTLVINEL